MHNKEYINYLLKQREEIEEEILALDPKALVYYELKRLTGDEPNVLLYDEDELLDAITTFNLSTSFITVEVAKEKYPDLFNSKREFAAKWIKEFFKPEEE